MLGGEKPVVGAPTVPGATVAAEVVRAGRGRRVIAFKKRRRQNSKRKRGYRDEFTVVRITEILADGKQPSLTAKPKAEAKPAESAVEAPAQKPKPKAKAKAPTKSTAKAKSPAKPKGKKK